MKLTEQDKRLLAYLEHSSRESVSKIARQCKLSREQVNYKIKKFLETGLIKNFVTFFNYPKLGYKLSTIVFLKLNKRENYKELKLIKNTISHTITTGEYDYTIVSISKDEKDFEEKLIRFAKENKDLIKDYKFIKPYFMELHDLKFLNINKPRYSFIEDSKSEKITKQEFEILKILEKDARIKVIDIARKLNISAELALYKLRSLQKRQIILGTKIHFDMTKLNYNYSAIQLDIENFSKDDEKNIINFARKHKHIDSILLSINSPQIMVQFFHKSQKELVKGIKEIQNLFNNIKSINILFPEQEIEVRSLAGLELT